MSLSRVRSPSIAALSSNCQGMPGLGAHSSARVAQPPPQLPPPPPPPHHLPRRFRQEQKEALPPVLSLSRFFSSQVPSSFSKQDGERARRRAPPSRHQKQPKERKNGAGRACRGRSSLPLSMRIWAITSGAGFKTKRVACGNSRAK